ncbi:hypothetical protein ACFXTH_007204 [Malus domestica]
MEACGIKRMGGERKAKVEGGGSGCGGEMTEFTRGYCDERLLVLLCVVSGICRSKSLVYEDAVSALQICFLSRE